MNNQLPSISARAHDWVRDAWPAGPTGRDRIRRAIRCVLVGALFGSIFSVPEAASAQSAVEFSARIVHVDGLPTADVQVRVIGFGTALTTGGGVFRTAVAAGTPSVRVELVESDWEVLYPRDGIVTVPREASAIPEIIVGRSLESVALQLFAERHERLATGLASVGAEQQEIRTILQEFVGQVTELLGVERAELENEIELQRGRREHFPQLSQTLLAYRLEARDLTRYFELYGRAGFTTRSIYDGLAGAADKYSAAFQKLNNERHATEAAVAHYWEGEDLRSDLRALYDYALGEVHAIHILPLNESLHTMWRSQMGQATPREVQAAQQEIDQAVRQLNLRLPELDRRVDRILTLLSRP